MAKTRCAGAELLLGGPEAGGGAGRAGVTEPADDGVDLVLLAEALQAGGDDEQLAAVGHGLAGAIHGLVGDPGAEELVTLHDRNDLPERGNDGDVLRAGLFGGE